MVELKESIKKLIFSYNDFIYKRYKQNNIAMIHAGRSGSTVVGNMLDEHNQIKWDSEIYSHHVRKIESGLSIVKTKNEALNYLRYRMSGTRKMYYGFEFKFFHLKMFNAKLKDFLEELDKLGFSKIILLERKNLLRKIVSSIIAHQTANWHKKTNNKPKLSSVNVDVNNIYIDTQNKSLIEFLDEYSSDFENFYKIIESYNNILPLTYEEDIQESPMIAYKKICEFVEVESQPVEVSLKKTNPFTLHQMIENFDEIVDYLENTPYKWMLE